MKFLLRSLLVLAVAVAFGILLYSAVQALPGAAPRPSTPALQRPPQAQAPRPERPENNREGGFRWRSILDVARRVIVFSAMVFLAILGKNFIFERRPKTKGAKD